MYIPSSLLILISLTILIKLGAQSLKY